MISLRKVDRRNVWALLKLSVTPEQRDFVATNTESIVEAYTAVAAGEVALPYGIYWEDTPVGFLMLGYGAQKDDPHEPAVAQGNYCLWRFMIDGRYQRWGYGRMALEAAIRLLDTEPCGPAEACWLSYEPENQAARRLYASVGFVENGQQCGGETVAVLPLLRKQ